VTVDRLSVGSGSAGQPAIAMNEYGRGLVTAAQNQTNLLFGGQLGTNGTLGALGRIDSLPNNALPYAAPGIAGLSSLLVAWQESSPSGAEIRLRYAPSPGNFGTEQVASNPLQGPTAAAAGLFTGGDRAGDAAAAWVQGAAGQHSIVVAQVFQPPGQPAPGASFAYSTSANPVVVWSPSGNPWGPVNYAISVDGAPVAQTPSTSLRVPAALTDGPHRWQVGAVNLGGVVTAGPTATVWVDTTPPRVLLALGGRGRARAQALVRLRIAASDPSNPSQPGARASGLAKIRIRWGDGHSRLVHRRVSRSSHKYARPGLYRLIVSATDHAGNTTSIAHYVRIVR